ncbi:MAG: hypothetical protein RI925_1256, partial [Pseudomonadota bacterium]
MNSLMTPLSDWDAGVLERLPTPLRRVESDSRRVLPGDVFLAFRGEYADGRDYIASALARGAAAVLWDPAEGFAWPAQWAATPNLAVPELRQRAGMV